MIGKDNPYTLVSTFTIHTSQSYNQKLQKSLQNLPYFAMRHFGYLTKTKLILCIVETKVIN